MTDYLIAGLGNPGHDNVDQRHNAGFWLIDRLAKRHNIKLSTGTNAFTGRGRIGDAEVMLMKPRTWMNSSGKAVAPALRRHAIPVENLVVVYDDLDLPEGRIRLRPKGSDGGHNGLKSIVAETGSGNFGRVRIGIDRPRIRGVPTWDADAVVKYVLASPSKASREVLDEALERAVDAVEAVIANGWERAMDVYNRQQEA